MTDTQKERLVSILDKAREKTSLLSALKARFQKLKGIEAWVEIDAGATVEVGALALYFGVVYECVEKHAKKLLDTPRHSACWKVYGMDDLAG